VGRWVLLRLGALCALGVCVSNAPAADLDHWSLCMSNNAPATAIKECSTIVDSARELSESLPYAYLYRGRAHLALKQMDPAFGDFTAAASKSRPSLAHAHFGLGQVYEQREDWGRAADEFGIAAASQSEDADIDDFSSDNEGSLRAESFAERGYSLYKKGDLPRALANLDQASRICATCSAPWRDKALVFDAQHRSAEAAEAADRAIELNPRSGAAFLVRGVNKARAGKTDQAVRDYDEAIRLSPTLGTAYRARANANTKLGRGAQAAADAAMAAQLEQGSAPSPVSAPVADPRLEKLLAAPTLGDDALKKMVSNHSWQARQGPWLATLEFRADGTLREDLKDTTEGSTLRAHRDGVWGVMRDEVCLYTNVGLCMSAHALGPDLVLVRADKDANRTVQEGTAAGTVEYVGSLASFQPLAAASLAPVPEFPVEELLLHGAPGKNTGPKTLFYYMHGFDGRARAHSPLPEYFVSELQQSRGWDVIDGNYPRSGVTEIRRLGAANFGVAVFLSRRLKELKAQGYQRIYVGGQSWGGWSSLLLATIPGLPVDGVVLVVPACCGWRSTGADHDDPNYWNNKLLFDQMIERVRYPTVGVFFLGDEYEPADRGAGAALALTQRGVANLMIDHPPGFSGHGSAWFPAFDYLYGGCIADFLESPRSGQCPQRRIAMEVGDFRGIVDARQLARRHLNAATLTDLKGRQFAVYPQGEVRRIISAEQTDVKGYGIGASLENSTFRAGSYCVRAQVKYSQPENTDEVCERLMKWSDDELVGLDPSNGHVLQWWVAYP
jgi:tetratricopeptide (TPR) repeat protein/pimeloyl-ACP methyl ester carboxylesterase